MYGLKSCWIVGNPNCRTFNALWVVEPALEEQPMRTKTS
jgi:hypothetical protein